MAGKEPLTKQEAHLIHDEAECLFATTFIAELGHLFDIYQEKQRIYNPLTHDKSMPDFEIVPKKPDHSYKLNGFIAELTKNAGLSKKDDQRRAAAGWLIQHPDYAYVQWTEEVLLDITHFPQTILEVFAGSLKYTILQDNIFRYIDDPVYKHSCKVLQRFPEPKDHIYQPAPLPTQAIAATRFGNKTAYTYTELPALVRK